MTEEQAHAIYTILAEECGATDDHMGFDRDSFVRYMMSSDWWFKEWRFCGHLGFGGKCRVNSNHPVPHVDYYPEDRSAKRDAMVDAANVRIAALFTPTPEPAGEAGP